MSLSELITGVEAHEKTLTVFNADEAVAAEVRERFADRNVAVRRESTPSGKPGEFVTLSEDGEVTVSAHRDGGSVADDGPGIPEGERAVLLGERDITQLEHGSGLGLWTVKAVTESYGGEMAIREDEGAVVDRRLSAA